MVQKGQPSTGGADGSNMFDVGANAQDGSSRWKLVPIELGMKSTSS